MHFFSTNFPFPFRQLTCPANDAAVPKKVHLASSLKIQVMWNYRRVAMANGLYFVLTGAWPLFHLCSFMAVTGYKTDQWLVKMVGLLAVSVGCGILHAVRRDNFDASLLLTLLLCNLSFLAIDVFYVMAGTISPVYLGDAAIECTFIFCNVRQFRRSCSGVRPHAPPAH
jgi:hypothetical protein